MSNNKNQKNDTVTDIFKSIGEQKDRILKEMSDTTKKSIKELKAMKRQEFNFYLDLTKKHMNEEYKEREKKFKQELQYIQEKYNAQIRSVEEELEAIKHKKEEIKNLISLEAKYQEDQFKKIAEIKNNIDSVFDNVSGKSKKEIETAKEKQDNLKKHLEQEENIYNKINERIKSLTTENELLNKKENNEIIAIDEKIENIKRLRQEETISFVENFKRTKQLKQIDDERYFNYTKQQRLIDAMFYESVNKHQKKMGYFNRTVDELVDAMGIFGPGMKILGGGTKMLVDFLTKPSKKKQEKKLEKDSIKRERPRIQPNTPEINVLDDNEGKEKTYVVNKNTTNNIDKSTTTHTEKKEEKTNKNKDNKSKIERKEKEEEKRQSVYEKVMNSPKRQKRLERNESRRKGYSDYKIKNDNNDDNFNFEFKEKKENADIEWFKKMNASIVGLRKDSNENSEKQRSSGNMLGLTNIKMLLMLATIGGTATSIYKLLDVWSDLEDVDKENEKSQSYREKSIEKQHVALNEIVNTAKENSESNNTNLTKEQISEFETKVKEYSVLEKKSVDFEKTNIFNLPNPATQKLSERFTEIMQHPVMKETPEAYSKFRNSQDIQLKEKESYFEKFINFFVSDEDEKKKENKANVEKKKTEIKENKKMMDTSDVEKTTKEDGGIQKAIEIQKEVNKINTQKETSSSGITVNVPENEQQNNILSEILDVLQKYGDNKQFMT